MVGWMGVIHVLLRFVPGTTSTCTITACDFIHAHGFARRPLMTRTVDIRQPLKEARLLIVVAFQKAFDALPQRIIRHL